MILIPLERQRIELMTTLIFVINRIPISMGDSVFFLIERSYRITSVRYRDVRVLTLNIFEELVVEVNKIEFLIGCTFGI